MQTYLYDDRNVMWQTVDAIGAQIYVLAIDEACGLVDVLIRFQPNARGRVHKHLCDFSTLVLQGELLFRQPDGSMKEIRPAGSYVQGRAHGEPHSEGAGELAAIVLFSFRGASGDMVLYLDTPTNEPFALQFSDFKATLANQIATGATAKLGARAP
jgi:hypothetical protein